MTAETAAQGPHALYVDELWQSLLPPVHPMANRRQTETLIGGRAPPSRRRAPNPTQGPGSGRPCTWPRALEQRLGRPFRTAFAADEPMMEAWYEQVAEGETIICLGDVTVDSGTL